MPVLLYRDFFWLILLALFFAGTAPQTPNKKNKTTEDKIDTEVDLTVYHQKLDDWAVEIIGNIDAELGTIHILRKHL